MNTTTPAMLTTWDHAKALVGTLDNECPAPEADFYPALHAYADAIQYWHDKRDGRIFTPTRIDELIDSAERLIRSTTRNDWV